MRRKWLPNAKNLVPALNARAPGHVCQHFPIPITAEEVEADSRPDVKSVHQRKQGGPSRHAYAEDKPVQRLARRPSQDGKRKQQRKRRREDMNLKEGYQRTEDYAGHNPDTPLFARSLYDEYQRCPGDRYTIKTSRSNVLQPKKPVKRMANIQQGSVRYQKSRHERCQTSCLIPKGSTQGIAGQSCEKRSEWRPEAYDNGISWKRSHLRQTYRDRVTRVMIENCRKALPLIIPNLRQSFGSQAARHKRGVYEKIVPRLEHDGSVKGCRGENEILGPAGCCNKRDAYTE